MNRVLSIYFLLLTSLTFACSKTVTSQKEVSSINTANFVTSETANKIVNNQPNRELQKQIEQIAASAKGRVGVAAVHLGIGESVALNSAEKFPMQSVYKFPIAMAILSQVDEGKLKLEQTVRVEKSDMVKKTMRSPIRDENPNGVELSLRELIRFAVSESDGTASDVLLRVAGGANEVDKFLKRIDVKEIIVANLEKEIGLDWETQYKNSATPEAAVKLLRLLHERRGLSESSRELLLKFMTETPTGLKRLRGLLSKDAVVAHKTGTSGSRDGITAATNDIGLIALPNGNHIAIAVFVSDSSADEATREAVIAQIAKAAWDKWSK